MCVSDSDHILCRMLIPTTELGRFDSMVMPFELEAYDILKSRSGKHKSVLNITFTDWHKYTISCLHERNKRVGKSRWDWDWNLWKISDISLVVYVFLVRSPALRSPRSGTPRRHLITPIPGTWAVSLPSSSSHPLSFFWLPMCLVDGLSLTPEEHEIHKGLKPLTFCLLPLPLLLFPPLLTSFLPQCNIWYL